MRTILNMIRGATGEGSLEARALPVFHTLAKDMSLNRGTTHFIHVLSHPYYYEYTCAPLSKLQVMPLLMVWEILKVRENSIHTTPFCYIIQLKTCCQFVINCIYHVFL